MSWDTIPGTGDLLLKSGDNLRAGVTQTSTITGFEAGSGVNFNGVVRVNTIDQTDVGSQITVNASTVRLPGTTLVSTLDAFFGGIIGIFVPSLIDVSCTATFNDLIRVSSIDETDIGSGVHFATSVNVASQTICNTIDVQSATIHSLAGPSQDHDAATKKYVDNFASGRDLLLTATANSASTLEITTNITSEYDQYIISLINVIPNTNEGLLLRTSSDSGSTFDSGSSDYEWNLLWVNSGTVRGQNPSGGSASEIALTPDSNAEDVADGGHGYNGEIILWSPINSEHSTALEAKGTFESDNDLKTNPVMVSGSRVELDVVNGIQIFFENSIPFDGELKLYGLKKTT